MTTGTRTTAGPDAAERVHAVRHRYARRGDRGTARDWAYPVYLTVVLVLVYVVPVVHLMRTSRPLLTLESSAAATPVACLVAAAAVWGAQLAGRYWGPLVLKPFLLHVFMSTDLPPARYLGTLAHRRLAYAALGTLLAVATATFLLTDLFDQPGAALVPQGAAVAVGIGALAPVAWLWGQVRPVRDNALLAAATAAAAAAMTLLARSAPLAATGLWLTAAATALAAAALARSGFRSLGTVDLARLARESARAAEAQTFAWTGTLHHALDLYRPEPRGLTTALTRPDGRLRGPLAQGAVRALRTPGRALAAAVSLPAGGILLALGLTDPAARTATLSWLTGAALVYAGSGWTGETWRALRDELTRPPLLGGGRRALLARTLAWPTTAVTTATALATTATLLSLGPLPTTRVTDTALLAAGTLLLVLGARFLREMKTNLPIELLLPIVTPLGDLSALRVFLWQFDGLATVLTGVLILNAIPTAPAATLTAAALTACCTWAALRRTGWTLRTLSTHLAQE
ncbi:hypothetical protein [Streptomyces sp. NPDC058486]|uniref:hypothetical protein n=1 Tax=unclassified Streptomyces TaxID=2593676 RepID=UPI0036510636